MDPNPDLRHRPKKSDVQTGDAGKSSKQGPFRPVLEDYRASNDPAFLPSQFQDHRQDDKNYKARKPWNSILLGLLLFMCGCAALVILCCDVIHGYEDEELEFAEQVEAENRGPLKVVPLKRSDRFYPLLFLGLVALIPGAFVSFLTLMACLGVSGYSYDDIP